MRKNRRKYLLIISLFLHTENKRYGPDFEIFSTSCIQFLNMILLNDYLSAFLK